MPATTLDAWAARANVKRVDVLSIDVEGWDALVLEGARGLLSSKSVELLEFEYHSVGMWSASQPTQDRRSLKTTVSALKEHGYSCFFEGKTTPAMVALSGNSWCDEYEFRKVGNVVCAHAPPVVKVLMERTRAWQRQELGHRLL